MTNKPNPPATHSFIAFDVALRLIRSLRRPVGLIRRRSPDVARQIEKAGSSIAACLAEGNRRVGKDRLHLFRVAAGSADEVRGHLLVAEAWGWIEMADIEEALTLADRELRLIAGLTR